MALPIKDQYQLLYDPKTPATWAVKLIGTEWDGIILSYNKLALKQPKKSKDALRFSFDTDIIYVPDRFRGIKFSDDKHVEYTEMLGKILFDIINDPKNKVREVEGKLTLEVNSDMPPGLSDALDLIKRNREAKTN